MDGEEASLRDRVQLAAEAVLDFAEPCYGPRGMAKAIQQSDESLRILNSGASALREVGIIDPDVQGYVDLAGAVQEHAGDQATGAVVLAARLVREACKGIAQGVPPAAYLDGYALALRQARASLASQTAADPEGRCLGSVVPGHPDLAPLVVAGLRRLGEGRAALPMDAIDIRTDAHDAAWLPGLVVRPGWEPRRWPTGEIGVLVLTDSWKPGTFKEGLSYRITADQHVGAFAEGEDRLRGAALDHLIGLKVGFLVCHRQVDEQLADACATAGIAVWQDAPATAVQRLERATGARPVARLMHATAGDVGRGTITARSRREAGWLLSGSGPSATLTLPAENAASRDQARDEAERLLRTAGAWLRESESVPGGGRWQRHVAKSLRSAADAAPGKTPLALRAAAAALDGLADLLVRNQGLDPLDMPLLADAGDVLDAALPVRVAVVGAFEMAIQVLRIDARYAKKPTSTAGLRGGEGKPLTMREMAGDVPPLM